jgi:hypothetical protein
MTMATAKSQALENKIVKKTPRGEGGEKEKSLANLEC